MYNNKGKRTPPDAAEGSSMIHLAELTHDQIITIYHEHMHKDFPPAEMHRLKTILKWVNLGRYACYGLFSDDELVGYVFLERVENNYLVDYIATFPELRNHGLGAKLIELLVEKLKGADSVIGEVEDPDFAETDDVRSLRTHRLGFYTRNGVVDTGVKVSFFGVHYILVEFPVGPLHSPEEIKSIWERY